MTQISDLYKLNNRINLLKELRQIIILKENPLFIDLILKEYHLAIEGINKSIIKLIKENYEIIFHMQDGSVVIFNTDKLFSTIFINTYLDYILNLEIRK